jgi:predicted nucleotidyltransferase
MNAPRPESDYDLVVYGKDNIEPAAKVITALGGYRANLHFGLDFVRAKYRHFTRLTREDLDLLIQDRWRHFRFHGLAMSVDCSDPALLSDRWATAQVRSFDAAHIHGVVVDGTQCYVSPKIIDVRTDTGDVRVFTWLNLYAGALRTGDEVAVHGRWTVMHGHQFLHVEDSAHAIRVVARTSTAPV